jgi:hypothetical protein
VLSGIVGEPRTLLPKQEHARAWYFSVSDALRSREVVDSEDRQRGVGGPAGQSANVLVMTNALITIGHHRASAIPSSASDDVDLRRHECIGVTDDRTDVHVVLPVLDCDVKRVPPGIEIRDDRLAAPVPVAVGDVAAVTFSKKRGVHPWIVGPRLRMRPDAYLVHPTILRPESEWAVTSATVRISGFGRIGSAGVSGSGEQSQVGGQLCRAA